MLRYTLLGCTFVCCPKDAAIATGTNQVLRGLHRDTLFDCCRLLIVVSFSMVHNSDDAH